MPLFLYPFLNTTSKTRPFEYLRLTSLGVIGALVKVCLFLSVKHTAASHAHIVAIKVHMMTAAEGSCSLD